VPINYPATGPLVTIFATPIQGPPSRS